MKTPRFKFPDHKKNNDISEIVHFIDGIPSASLLIDSSNNKIIYGKQNCTDAQTRRMEDLGTLSVTDLFPDWLTYAPSNLQQNTASNQLNNKSRATLIGQNQISLKVELAFADNPITENHLILNIYPIDDSAPHGIISNISSFNANDITQIILAHQTSSIDEAINLILDIGRKATDASTIAVYIAKEGTPALERVQAIGQINWLPTNLFPEDVIRIRAQYLWKPGRKNLSSLHHIARNEGRVYISTAPVGDLNAIIGLVVISSDSTPIPENINETTNILASSLTSCIQNHLTIQWLEQTISDQEYQLKISSEIEHSIHEALIFLNQDLRVIRINKSAENMLGYNMKEAHGQHAESILIGSPRIIQSLQYAQNGIPTNNIGNVRLLRRSGEAFPAYTSIFPINNEGKSDLILMLISDLSEQEQIQEQAQKLEQQAFLGDILAVFSHEVRNPINNLSTGLDLLEFNLKENDTNHELVSRLQQDCDRLEGLMKSILSSTRSTDYAMGKVDIIILFNRLISQFQPRLDKYNIEYNLNVEPDIPPVRGNYRALEQVVTNIVDNAIQVMKNTGGQLAVKIQLFKETSGRNMVNISIADTGPGIPKEDQEHIFQPFFTT